MYAGSAPQSCTSRCADRYAAHSLALEHRQPVPEKASKHFDEGITGIFAFNSSPDLTGIDLDQALCHRVLNIPVDPVIVLSGHNELVPVGMSGVKKVPYCCLAALNADRMECLHGK